MFTKHGKEPSWILQFDKYERILMLAMAEYEVSSIEELRKKYEKNKIKI